MTLNKNIYLQQLSEITIHSKYNIWYCDIIRNALDRASNRMDAERLLGYIECHHILPRAFKLGGDNDPMNFSYLTAREHFICQYVICC
jgi:hypothetical protein